MQDRVTLPNWPVFTLLLKPRFQRILLVLILLVLLAAGLHPFRFVPKNGVTWLPSSTGVLVHGHGEIVGQSPLAKANDLASADLSRGITIEFRVTPLTEDSDVKDLLSVYVSRTREPFAIESWEKKLIFGGIFRDAQGHRRFQHIGIDDVFSVGSRRFVTLTSGPDGSRIYLEGKLQHEFPGLALEAENFDGTLILGQTASGRQEWRGSFRALAFYLAELTPEQVAENFADWERGDWSALETRAREYVIFPFNNHGGGVIRKIGNLGSDLVIPRRMKPVDPIILEVPSGKDFADLSDVSVNILGFIPFGTVLLLYLVSTCRWSNWKAAAVTILLGFLLSLAIELLQVLLPTRDSSLLDVVNNTIGTGIGAGVGIVFFGPLRRLARGTRFAVAK